MPYLMSILVSFHLHIAVSYLMSTPIIYFRSPTCISYPRSTALISPFVPISISYLKLILIFCPVLTLISHSKFSNLLSFYTIPTPVSDLGFSAL